MTMTWFCDHVNLLSVHLSCWLDLEKYRRTGQKEQWSQIANKYLNSNYFFGPESPATTQQQDDVSHMVYIFNAQSG